METADRTKWVLITFNTLNLLMDHQNLIFLLDRVAGFPDLMQGYLRKQLQWAVRLGAYSCMFVQIK